jgi:hypothetical protein
LWRIHWNHPKIRGVFDVFGQSHFVIWPRAFCSTTWRRRFTSWSTSTYLGWARMGQDKHCIWPGIPGLVNIQKAIENDHRNSWYSWFTH